MLTLTHLLSVCLSVGRYVCLSLSVMLQMMGNMGGQMAGGPAGGPAGSHMMPAGGMTNGSAPPTPPAEVPAAADAPAPEG